MFDRIAPTYDRSTASCQRGLDVAWRKRAVAALDGAPRGPRRSTSARARWTSPRCREGAAARARSSRSTSPPRCSRRGRAKAPHAEIDRRRRPGPPVRGRSSSRRSSAASGCATCPTRREGAREVRRVLAARRRASSSLEFFRPTRLRDARLPRGAYARAVLPAVGGLVSGDRDAYAVPRRSMDGFLSRAEYERALARRRASRASPARTSTLGIASIVRGAEVTALREDAKNRRRHHRRERRAVRARLVSAPAERARTTGSSSSACACRDRRPRSGRSSAAETCASRSASRLWGIRDYKAPFASGSAGWHAMVDRAVLDGHRRADRPRHLRHAPDARRRRDAEGAARARRRAARDAAQPHPPREPHRRSRAPARRSCRRCRPSTESPATLADRARHGRRARARSPRRLARPRRSAGGRDERARSDRMRRSPPPGSAPIARGASRGATSTRVRERRADARDGGSPRGRARSPTRFAPKRSGDVVRVFANARRRTRRAASIARRRAAANATRAASRFLRRRRRSRASPARWRARVRVDWADVGARARAGRARLRRERARRTHREQARPRHRRRDAAKKVKGEGMVEPPIAQDRRDRVAARRGGRRAVFVRPRAPSATRPRTRRMPDVTLDRDRRARSARRAPVVRRRRRALSRTRTSSRSAQLANEVRERLHGDRTYFNRNMRIEVTNVCVASCLFCSFAKLEEGAPGAHTMKLEEAWRELETRMDDPPAEIHIVNGLHPGLPFSYYEDLLRGFKRIKPDVHMKCFTAVEIHFFAQHYGMTHEEVLVACATRGSTACPEGARRSSTPRSARASRTTRRPADEYLEVHRVAHRLGMRTNATMLYGHIETFEHRVDHLLRLRALQDETRGLQAFIPLAFHPDGNGMKTPAGADRRRRSADARRLAPPPRQRPTPQGLLGQHDAGGRADRPPLRRRRHRRHDRARDDLQRRGLRLPERALGTTSSCASSVEAGRTPDRARHALQRRPRAPAGGAAGGGAQGARAKGA